jgi:predicted RNA-binding protein Jag
VKDWVFVGANFTEALKQASQTLGIPPGDVSYIVLEPDEYSTARHEASPVRIAVLAEAVASAAEKAETLPCPEHDPRATPEQLIQQALTVFQEASRIPLKASIESIERGIVVAIDCHDASFLWGDHGEVFDALSLLVDRFLRRSGFQGTVRLTNPGVNEKRATQIETLAREAARRVLQDGIPQVLSDLNSFERRIVHLALMETPGIRTRSEGERGRRRLVIELASDTKTADN